MIINCDNCGGAFNKKPSDITKSNYCSKACRHDHKRGHYVCAVCEKSFIRLKCAASPTPICGPACAAEYTSKRMTEMNRELNPDRMTLPTRTKIREARIDPNSKHYAKFFGRHEHRVVAEKKIGRALRPGEVVHHHDTNKRNNEPENLKIFKSQAEHARWHKNEIHNPELNEKK